MELSQILEIVLSLIGGGTITALFTLRQTRESKKLDNAERLVKEYTDLLEKYKARDAEQEARIQELQDKVTAMEKDYETKVAAIEVAYNEKVEEMKLNYEKEIAELKKNVRSLEAQIGLMKRSAAKKASRTKKEEE